MDFRFTAEEEAFRQEVREFLAREVSQEIRQEALESAGPGLGGHCRAFLRKRGERGWAGIEPLPRCAVRGRIMHALGCTEPEPGSDLDALASRALEPGSHYRVDAVKILDPTGHYG